MLCNRQIFVIVICVLLASIEADEYENNLNEDDTRPDETDKCIPHSQILDHEIEERGMITIKETQTSFIPSYCKRRNSNDDDKHQNDLALIK
mgnify:CR=1 FL=1